MIRAASIVMGARLGESAYVEALNYLVLCNVIIAVTIYYKLKVAWVRFVRGSF